MNLSNYFISIRFRTLGLAILSVVILVGGAVLWKFIFGEAISEAPLSLLLSVSSLCLAISSAYVIKYKEMPRTGGLPSVKGLWAVFGGIVALIVSVSAFVFFTYNTIVEYIH